jgi:transcriptional regulator with XRE-family HTH domain
MLADILRNYQGDMNQQQYARHLGISEATLSLVYNGKRGIGTDVLRALARAYPDAADDIAAALSAPVEDGRVAV